MLGDSPSGEDEGQQRLRGGLLALGLSAGVAAVDYVIPDDVSVGILYVVPLLAAQLTRRPAFIWLIGVLLVAINQITGMVDVTSLSGNRELIAFNHLLASVLILGLTALIDLLCRQSNRLRALRHQAVDRMNEAVSSARLKDRLLTAVSHELKTPLTSIIAWTHILRRREAEGELARGLSIIESKAELEAHLIEDVLDASELAAGVFRLERSTTTLSRIVQRLVRRFEGAFGAKGVRLAEYLDDDDQAPIQVDVDAIEKAIFQLLYRALAVSGRGETVSLSVDLGPLGPVLSVEMAGRVRGPAQLEHLFDGFSPEEMTERETREDLGLGLAIVRGIVELHGGEVAAIALPDLGRIALVVRLPSAARRSASADGLGAPFPSRRPGDEVRPGP